MKKIIYIILLLGITLFFTSCGKKEENVNAFKSEYESINNKENDYGYKTRELNIPEDNPFVKVPAGEIINMMNAKETFVVYFGFPSCPWCRSVLEELINSLNDAHISKIYYVDVHDIRNTFSIDEKTNELVETKKGTQEYYDLLERMGNVLTSYVIKDASGENIDTKQKRIMAPNVVVVQNGEATALETGIPESLTDPYMELSEGIKKDMKNIFDSLLEPLKNSSVCSPTTGC